MPVNAFERADSDELAASDIHRNDGLEQRCEVRLDELHQRQRAADAFLPPEMFERPFECFSRVMLGGKPPRCRRLEPGPPVRYAHTGLPSTARFLSSRT